MKKMSQIINDYNDIYLVSKKYILQRQIHILYLQFSRFPFTTEEAKKKKTRGHKRERYKQTCDKTTISLHVEAKQ